MKHKRKGYLGVYIIVLFLFCMVLDDLFAGFYDFCVGFYMGFRGMEHDYIGVNQIVEPLQQNDWIVVVLSTVIVGIIFYVQMRRKVVRPIEQLTESMEAVSHGDLSVRVTEDGAFEFGQIEEAFNYMVKELETAKRSKEMQEERNRQLYAGIAHDLKTPMTMVKGYAKLLECEDLLSDEDRKKYLQTIQEQTEHTNQLLDSLLAYSKLENQSYELRREKNDIAECLRTCVANCYSVLEQMGMELELLIPDAKVEFSFDVVEMKRVFHNLLSNLARHNPKDTKCMIQLEESDKVRIVIADKGPKIPEDFADVLFEPFVVGDASRNTKNGSGLGLSVAKRIVERHDGSICYEENWKDGYKAFVIEL